MVPFAHGNDLAGSLRYPASACGLFALKPTRARNPLGPEYGDVAASGAAEHALTRSVRDSAALLDATSGPDLGDPYWAPPPARPFLDEVGADPGRLRIGYTARTPDGDLGHPDCVAAANHAARLCASLGHEVTQTDWPGFTPEVGAAFGTMISAAAAWIMRYWIRHLGREPGAEEIEPLNRALWQAGEKVTAAQWLLAVGDVQRFSRRIARFFTGFDAFLTPTMSTPPLPIGEMVSTPEDPWRSLQVSGQTVRYAGVVANLTGNPAMSVPLWWNDDGLPIGVHFLGRFGDEATLIRMAAQLEAAQPWAGRGRARGRPPTAPPRRGRGSRSAAHDGGTDERRGLRQGRVLHLGDRETGGPDGVERGAVAVTAHHQPVQPVQPVLQAGRARVARPDVLDEQQAAAGAQHPAQLPQRPGLVVDTAQDQRGDRHVEAVVVEGKVLGWRAQDPGGRALLAGPALQAAQHRGVRLGYRQRPDRRAVVGQVRPGPAADLQHVAACPGEQPLPEGTQPGLLGLGHLTVVRQGEELGPQAHGFLTSSRWKSLITRT